MDWVQISGVFIGVILGCVIWNIPKNITKRKGRRINAVDIKREIVAFRLKSNGNWIPVYSVTCPKCGHNIETGTEIDGIYHFMTKKII